MTAQHPNGFTLAQLLISLAILGIIETFTIPRIVQLQPDSRNSVITTEALSTVSAAYFNYKQQNTVTGSNFNLGDLTPYLNYVSVATDTVTAIDNMYGSLGLPGDGANCSYAVSCYLLHNGARIQIWGQAGTGSASASSFGDTNTTNFIYFFVDPDGTLTSPGTTNGPGKSVLGILYYNGKITTAHHCQSGDTTSENGVPGTWCDGIALDPPWFSW